MALSKAQKAEMNRKIADRLKEANAAIVAEYRGLTVAELTDLRVRLRESKAEFRVFKNRIAKKALQEGGLPNVEPISGAMKGPVGLVVVYGDAAQAAKALLDFAKDKENFKVTTGVLDGKAVSPAELKAISELPSKPVLLGRLVGTLIAPHRNLLGVLGGVQRNLVQVINAIKEKKS
jgi:large subunit ribosomal protein L10